MPSVKAGPDGVSCTLCCTLEGKEAAPIVKRFKAEQVSHLVSFPPSALWNLESEHCAQYKRQGLPTVCHFSALAGTENPRMALDCIQVSANPKADAPWAMLQGAAGK